jgi:hypothetical protein
MIAEDYLFHFSQYDAMQQAMRFIDAGYIWWTGGTVEAKKVVRMVTKFHESYEVLLERHHDERRLDKLKLRPAHRKAKNWSGATIVLHPAKDKQRLTWSMFSTEPLPNQRMREATHKHGRFVWEKQYQLVPIDLKNKKAGWTYKMTDHYLEQVRMKAFEAALADDDEALTRYFTGLSSAPMFVPVRDQLMKAQANAGTRYVAAHGKAYSPIEFPLPGPTYSDGLEPLSLASYLELLESVEDKEASGKAGRPEQPSASLVIPCGTDVRRADQPETIS